MAFMASNAITAVHYSQSGRFRHIVEVSVSRVDLVGRLVPYGTLRREDVVNGIKYRNQIFVTCSGRYFLPTNSPLVRVFPVNGTDYIKTEPNGNPEDNLGNLPEY